MNKMYKYEMHAHTCPCSGGGGEMEEHIDALIERGFAGMVITNHFYRGDNRIDKDLPWEEFVAPYEEDYERGKRYAQSRDFDLLFGIEEHICGGREVLIYGIDPDFLRGTPSFKTAGLCEYAEAVHGAGGVIFQAHPYRERPYIAVAEPFAEQELLDGIEAFNGGNRPQENEKAEAFAKERGLRVIGGSDGHKSFSVGYGGIVSKIRIRDGETLVKVLKSGEYTLYKDESIYEIRRKYFGF